MDPETRAITRRLDELLDRQHADGLLDLAASLAQTRTGPGIRFPIGLLVNGTVIRGSLGAVESVAEAMDKTMQAIAPYVFTQPVDESLQETIFSAYMSVVEAWREREAKGRELLKKRSDFGNTMEELGDDDYRDAVLAAAPKSYIQLVDARVEFGGRFIDVGVVRVRVDQIGAWWPLTSEEGVNINFNAARTDDVPR